MSVKIIRPEVRPAVGELKKHVSELGRRFVFFDKNTFPEGNIYLIVREVLNVTEPYQSAELRRHTVDSIMLFLGKGEGLSGMLVEVEIDGKKYTLESPVAVYVPAGTWHTYRILKGSGIYMKIVFAPHGDYNAVTE
jgi:2-isopropylmalate synthase